MTIIRYLRNSDRKIAKKAIQTVLAKCELLSLSSSEIFSVETQQRG